MLHFQLHPKKKKKILWIWQLCPSCPQTRQQVPVGAHHHHMPCLPSSLDKNVHLGLARCLGSPCSQWRERHPRTPPPRKGGPCCQPGEPGLSLASPGTAPLLLRCHPVQIAPQKPHLGTSLTCPSTEHPPRGGYPAKLCPPGHGARLGGTTAAPTHGLGGILVFLI